MKWKSFCMARKLHAFRLAALLASIIEALHLWRHGNAAESPVASFPHHLQL
jgi:hypothetical protein